MDYQEAMGHTYLRLFLLAAVFVGKAFDVFGAEGEQGLPRRVGCRKGSATPAQAFHPDIDGVLDIPAVFTQELFSVQTSRFLSAACEVCLIIENTYIAAAWVVIESV